MRTSHPPVVATWLLEYSLSGHERESITGDLIEEYRQSRSRAWYWRQVLVAIWVSFYKGVRVHPILTIGAVATGWAIIFLYRFIFRGMAVMFYSRLELSHLRGIAFINWIILRLYWDVIYAIVLALGGWTVARLYRPHQMAMVLAFVASKLFTFSPHFFLFAAHSFSDAGYLRYVGDELLAMASTTGMILLGGLLAGRTEREAPVQKVQTAT